MKEKGKIFVMTGASGAGKTEVTKRILKNKSLKLKKVVTCTTRKRRLGEVEGRDYFFSSKEKFLKDIKEKEFFEYATVYGNYYGSKKSDVDKIVGSGYNVLFVVDIQGAKKLILKNKGIISIFIDVENIKELKKRLEARQTESSSVIRERVEVAKKERKSANLFKYKVENKYGKLKDTIKKVTSIMEKESTAAIHTKLNSL